MSEFKAPQRNRSYFRPLHSFLEVERVVHCNFIRSASATEPGYIQKCGRSSNGDQTESLTLVCCWRIIELQSEALQGGIGSMTKISVGRRNIFLWLSVVMIACETWRRNL